MQLIYLLFIVTSAFLHSFYNFLMRKNDGDRYFLNGVFIVAATLSVASVFIDEGYKNIPWQYAPYVFGAALFYTLYQVFTNKAYELSSSISTSYPLTVLSPLFIPIWAYFILGERISPVTGLGIFITVLGAIMVQIKDYSFGELKKMFRFSKDYKAARYAIAASFVYSFGAIFDKAKVSYFPPTTYLALIVSFMAINMFVYMLITKSKGFISGGFKNWKLTTIGGVAMLFSFLFFRLALAKVHVSIAVPVRQVAIIFAILFGVVFLKEKFNLKKLAAVIVIFAGIILINAGIR